MCMDKEVENKIQRCLKQLELEKNVRVLLAVESGSRAWGFPSSDSDYDVRIIYANPYEHYLSIFDQKDTLEIPITDELDIAGWDISKALLLMYAGNAVIHEWLNSPIVYQQNELLVARIKSFSRKAFNPTKAFYHYHAMSAKKFDLEEGESFTAKRLLYSFRTLLCADWIVRYDSPPPMIFQNLMDALLKDEKAVFTALKQVIAIKNNQQEDQKIEVVDSLINYAHKKLAILKEHKMGKFSIPQKDEFDALFQWILN